MRESILLQLLAFSWPRPELGLDLGSCPVDRKVADPLLIGNTGKLWYVIYLSYLRNLPVIYVIYL